MSSKTRLITFAALLFSLPLHAAEITNLYEVYTAENQSSAKTGSTYRPGNWSFYHGYPAVSELTFSKSLGEAGRNARGYGGQSDLGTPLISQEAVFDNQRMKRDLLCFHTGEGAGDKQVLHLRWTADKAYSNGIKIHCNLKLPGNKNRMGDGDLKFAMNGDKHLILMQSNYKDTSTVIDSSTYPSLSKISAGDTIELVLTNHRGSFVGDQTFGNFIISEVSASEQISPPVLSIDFQGETNLGSPTGFVTIQPPISKPGNLFTANSNLRASSNGITFSFTSGKAYAWHHGGSDPIHSDVFCFNTKAASSTLGFKVSGLKPNASYRFNLKTGTDGPTRVIGITDGQKSLTITNGQSFGEVTFQSNRQGEIRGYFTSGNTEANLSGLTITADSSIKKAPVSALISIGGVSLVTEDIR